MGYEEVLKEGEGWKGGWGMIEEECVWGLEGWFDFELNCICLFVLFCLDGMG